MANHFLTPINIFSIRPATPIPQTLPALLYLFEECMIMVWYLSRGG